MKKEEAQKHISKQQTNKYQKSEKRKPLNSKNHNKQIKYNSLQKNGLKLNTLIKIVLPENFEQQHNQRYKRKQKQLEKQREISVQKERQGQSERQRQKYGQKDRQKYIESINQKNEKQFQNISCIAQKNQEQSFISNKQDSLDGIDQFFINVQEEQIIQIQKQQDQSSSFPSFQQDWTYLQKQYQAINENEIQQNQAIKSQSYFQITLEKYPNLHQILNRQNNKRKYPFLNEAQINHFCTEQQINQIKQIKSSNQQKFKHDSVNNRLRHSYQVLKDLKIKKNIVQAKNRIQIQKGQMIFSQNQNYLQKQQPNIELFRNFQIPSEKNLFIELEKDQIQQEDQQYNQNQSLNPLQNYEEGSEFIQGSKNLSNQAEAFIKFVNRQNGDKAKGDDSQNQIANISKIMKSQSMWRHNKSHEQQNKEKQQDQVVAMLQNQLRGKQQAIEETYQQNLQTKQTKKGYQKNISTQLILKGLDQDADDFQLRNFNQVIQMRQKWIQSQNDRNMEWKQYQLSLIQKMKKIIKNPYIELEQQQIKKQN